MRHTSEFLTQLKETGHPLVLTINGNAEIVLQDAKSYQRLMDLAERLESMKRGAGRPMEAVFDALEKELQPPAAHREDAENAHQPPPRRHPAGSCMPERSRR